MSQLLIIGTLAIKINSIETTLYVGAQAEAMRERLNTADKRSKWFAIAITSIYSFIALSVILVACPILNVIHQEFYNMIYLMQLILTTILLLVVLAILYNQIKQFNSQSNNCLS